MAFQCLNGAYKKEGKNIILAGSAAIRQGFSIKIGSIETRYKETIVYNEGAETLNRLPTEVIELKIHKLKMSSWH